VRLTTSPYSRAGFQNNPCVSSEMYCTLYNIRNEVAKKEGFGFMEILEAITFIYILVTVYLGIILIYNQFDAQFF
jgi:hypothetical protein